MTVPPHRCPSIVRVDLALAHNGFTTTYIGYIVKVDTELLRPGLCDRMASRSWLQERSIGNTV
jgi:hypothetical protein